MYASVGISSRNKVFNKKEALLLATELEENYPNLLIEKFISGKEYTVLVYGEKVLSGERIFTDDLNHYTENGPFSTIKRPEEKYIQELNKISL